MTSAGERSSLRFLIEAVGLIAGLFLKFILVHFAEGGAGAFEKCLSSAFLMI